MSDNAVAYIAKVRILEQITTPFNCTLLIKGCCLYSKGKNFRANHNNFRVPVFIAYAVAYIAKVRILEQITTLLGQWIENTLLLLI